MDIATAAVTFVEAAGICIKLSRGLLNRFQAYKNADKRIVDLILKIEDIWYKTETQIKFLERIIDSLDDRFINLQNACLQRLNERLGRAIIDFETLTGTDLDTVSFSSTLNVRPAKRIRYALIEKKLQKNLEELQSWHKEFDPSWFLIGRAATSTIDAAISEYSGDTAVDDRIKVIGTIREAIEMTRQGRSSTASVFREPNMLSPNTTSLPNSSLSLGTLQIDSTPVLLDMTVFETDLDKVVYTPRIRDLARLLSLSEPETLGLLQCLGVIKHFEANGNLAQFQFIYNIPPTLSQPTTLRTRLSKPPISLDARMRLSKSLARGVMAVHSADLVHKNIRPETIVVFEDATENLPISFLVGFERFRPFNAGTNLIGDMVWERNIYRFPNRQGIRPEDVYVMQHDIYSLGVCLLEIGMWTSFVIPTNPPQPGPRLDISKQLAMKEYMQAAWEIKKIFVDMAKEFLPGAMGLAYTEVTISCLTCLDQGATNLFGDVKDLYDEDEIVVGAAFIEKVLMRLDSIRL